MKSSTWSFYGEAVGAAVERIVSGLDDALDLEGLARAAALSPFHFHRIFRGMTGETPLQLHRRLRLERAAWRLLHDGRSVTAIAFDAGYETHEAFTRAFGAAFGKSPSEFRALGQGTGGAGGGQIPTQLPSRSSIHFSPGMSAQPDAFTTQGADDMDVHTEELPELHLASVRHIGPYRLLGKAFQELTARVSTAHLFGPETMMMVIYHDDPETTPESELRSDAAITVPEGTELPEGLEPDRLRAGRYARVTHVGSYQGLGDAWARFMGEWLPRSGERVGDGVPFEVYRNDPSRTPPEKLRTDLFLPLE